MFYNHFQFLPVVVVRVAGDAIVIGDDPRNLQTAVVVVVAASGFFSEFVSVSFFQRLD